MSISNNVSLRKNDVMPGGEDGRQTGTAEPVDMLEVGRTFLDALARRDFEGLEACFQTDTHFRALVPPGILEGVGPQETAAWLRRWFGDTNVFAIQHTDLDQVCDRLHMSYRIRLLKDGVLQIIEQQAYCVVDDGRIGVMNLLCSGFRPEAAGVGA